MRNIKEEDKKIRLSITISSEVNDMIEKNTTNKSSYIERCLYNYFTKCGYDTTKIKL